MAVQHLTVLHSPEFPQVFSGALDQLQSRVERVVRESQLSPCCYESPESRPGAADSLPCSQTATVHHLASEQEFCAKHFREVSRG